MRSAIIVTKAAFEDAVCLGLLRSEDRKCLHLLTYATIYGYKQLFLARALAGRIASLDDWR